ncbi:uncharacterized protein [Musca autumnalis]|uniref:uncharacterized protein n=1 Tax=Musca autumnalis TaxID=221902 RepID=UPI003CF3FA74
MSSWGNICRVCASPADYDIFDKIPVYLHANSKDFLHWQTPIYELMQDTTGLRITREDGLPQHICALCISYLKHAFTFREKAIEICLNFIAVKEYKEILKGKTEFEYTKAINDIVAPRPNKNCLNEENATTISAPPPPTSVQSNNNTNEEDNTTTNCFYKDQNKVSKRLITTSTTADNSNMARVLTNQTKSCLLYLIQLYENPDMLERISGGVAGGGQIGFGGQGPSSNRARHKKHNLMKSASADMAGGSGGGYGRKRQNYEDEYQRNMSSDEYDEPESNGDSGNNDPTGGNHKNTNIFSYKEKIFEEDDIMDLEELKDLISVNIESTCKEHKCKYCSRRFMFEETIQEHLKTCVDYKLTEFFEEIKNLMYIKRCKEISPHEFIRRMIFSIRKTCVWLKENLIDTTLPDLLESKDAPSNIGVVTGETVDVTQKSKDQNNKMDNLLFNLEAKNTQPLVVRPNPINASNNILHVVANATNNKINNHKVNKTVIASSFLQDDSTPLLTSGSGVAATIVRQTPINISNNILHEIERSEMKLKKPIARLATTTLNNAMKSPMDMMAASNNRTQNNPERMAFLEKLQNAAKTITPPPVPLSHHSHLLMGTGSTSPVIDSLPLIAVRQDLLETTTTTTTTTRTRRSHVSPLLELLQNSTKTPTISGNSNSGTLVNPCARCPTCNLLFETLDALEIHNALQHNNKADNNVPASLSSANDNDLDKEAEHRRIIALFENEDEF